MFSGLVIGLIVAYLMTLVGADVYIIDGIKDLFDITITVPAFYITFAIIGIAGEVIEKIRK